MTVSLAALEGGGSSVRVGGWRVARRGRCCWVEEAVLEERQCCRKEVLERG